MHPHRLQGTGQTRVSSFFVDQAKVDTAKAAAQAGGAAFVSTNAIIPSHFSRAIDVRLLIFAMDFRGRVGPAAELDAGNYEAGVFLDAEIAARPELVRKMLQAGAPFLRATSEPPRPLPGCCETLNCCCFAPCSRHKQTLGLVANWASAFAAGGELHIEGATQGLHLLFYEAKDAAWPVAVVYRLLPGRLAVMYFAPDKHYGTVELAAAGGGVLGDVVCSPGARCDNY